MAAHPSPMNEAADEKQQVLTRLRSSREVFLAALGGVSEEQARRRPAEDSWSILECAEHVVVAEQFMFAAVEKRRPAVTPTDRDKDALVQTLGLDRSQKFNSPERSRPAARFATLADAVAAFEVTRAKTLTFVEANQEDLRTTTVMHVLAGVIDSCQALLLIALHAERHAAQIEQIKSGQS